MSVSGMERNDKEFYMPRRLRNPFKVYLFWQIDEMQIIVIWVCEGITLNWGFWKMLSMPKLIINYSLATFKSHNRSKNALKGQNLILRKDRQRFWCQYSLSSLWIMKKMGSKYFLSSSFIRFLKHRFKSHFSEYRYMRFPTAW